MTGPVDRSGVSLTDGYFSTSVDFGADAFTGEGRQMQVLVKCSGDADYVALTGMVSLAAAPYAHSLRPGAEVSSSSAGELGAVVTVEDAYTGSFASTALKGQSSQGTGVYGQGGAYGLYSQGNAHVEGDLTWRSKTGYISVAAGAFQPMAEG